jgi:hypothetical protein
MADSARAKTADSGASRVDEGRGPTASRGGMTRIEARRDRLGFERDGEFGIQVRAHANAALE